MNKNKIIINGKEYEAEIHIASTTARPISIIDTPQDSFGTLFTGSARQSFIASSEIDPQDIRVSVSDDAPFIPGFRPYGLTVLMIPGTLTIEEVERALREYLERRDSEEAHE